VTRRPIGAVKEVMAIHRSDALLVADVLRGDLDAFTFLVRRHRDDHMRFAVRMLGNRLDADEALQSAWLRAFRHLNKCADPARFGAWVFAIVANECRSAATRRARRERRVVDDETVLDTVAVDDGSDARATREEIERALDELPPDQREAFILKHVEQLSYDEMADVTGAGVSALKMRVTRACERLRKLLEEAQDVRV
jgi:RNA polymerase sigma-70 factor (ECF subfamily)